MASFDRRLYTDLQDIRASVYTGLVPVDSGALLLALNVIVCWEWRGVPNEEDNCGVTCTHVSEPRITMTMSV